MKVSTRRQPKRGTEDVEARYERLHAELRKPAERMLRRVFRGSFDHATIEDIYSSAWLGTLRALRTRGASMSDDALRSYLFAAVANHASKELRRRGRKPTTPLEHAPPPAGEGSRPEERAESAETSQIARDLLVSMPARRRAVMLLRYGWGLEPKEVCALVADLSPRAYRKEVTRGVSELTGKLGMLERGEWCRDRRSALEAFAAGVADPETRRQAQQHLAHCRECSDFVARLAGQLNDLGGGVGIVASAGVADGRGADLGERLGELTDRARDALSGLGSRGATDVPIEGASAVSASGGTRGIGAAGAGAVAKLTGLGAVGKATIACVGTGAAATACVAAGVVAVPDLTERETERPPTLDRVAVEDPPIDPALVELPAEDGPATPGPGGGGGGSAEPEPEPDPEPEAPPASPAPAAPPAQQEFGLPGAATASASGTGGGSPTGGGGGTAAQQEFGP